MTAVDVSPSARPFTRRPLAEMASALPPGRASIAEPGSYRVAVVGPDAEVRWAEAHFQRLIGSPSASPDCRDLVERAIRLGRAAGLVATPGRGGVVVEALNAHSHGEWPLPLPARAALARDARAVLLLAFAPSRSPELNLRAAQSLGLRPREADLAAALLEAPRLEGAAAEAGMSPQTARDTLKRACARVGARGASDLVARLLDLSCGVATLDEGSVGAALGLSAAEARVAVSIGRGDSVQDTARRLSVTRDTVKSHRKSIFLKTHVTRDRDLRRLVLEAARMAELRESQEVVLDDRSTGERLRIVSGGELGRRVALTDYGPASGRPLMVLHGYSSWRRLPMAMVIRLQQQGWRPIVAQRPGYGLTDPAVGDHLDAAADDMAAVLDALNAPRAAVFARGGAAPVALAFAKRHPSRFARGVLVNPNPTRECAPAGAGLVDRTMRLLLRRPALVAPIVDQMARRTSSRNLRALIQRSYLDTEDRLPTNRPDILDHLVRDAQFLVSRSTRGLIEELSVYSKGWTLPPGVAVGPWRLAISPRSWSEAGASAYDGLPGCERRPVEGVVVLRAYTEPEPLVALLDP